MLHAHAFSETEWPFPDPIDTLAFTTDRVMLEGYPVLVVTHDHDGYWYFLCGTTMDGDDWKTICLGCAYEKTPEIGDWAALPLGWCAQRESASAPWQTFPLEDEDGDEE
jgi:hypothetical protein